MNRRKKLQLLLLQKKKLALLAAEAETAKNQATTRSIWVHETIAQKKEKGIYHTLVQELRLDNDRHSQYFKMNKQCELTRTAYFYHSVSFFRSARGPGKRIR